jgi:hypothetical protein
MRACAVVLLLVAGSPAVFGQETAKAVVERAVAAHGGAEKLSRARADRSRWRGVVWAGNASAPFTSEVTVRLPKKYKSSVTLREGDRTRVVVHEVDGDAATITIDGVEQKVQGTHANQLRQTLELEAVMRLAPLLDEKAYVLTLLGDFRMGAQTLVGVLVKGGGQREVKLYFDRQTSLLVKAEQKIDGDGKDVVQEVLYRDHRDVGGYKRPGRAAVYRDGKKVMEAELIDAVPLEGN